MEAKNKQDTKSGGVKVCANLLMYRGNEGELGRQLMTNAVQFGFDNMLLHWSTLTQASKTQAEAVQCECRHVISKVLPFRTMKYI